MKSNNKSTIAGNTKKYRKKLDTSQDRLSKLADITYVIRLLKSNQITNRNPTIETFIQIHKSVRCWCSFLIK